MVIDVLVIVIILGVIFISYILWKNNKDNHKKTSSPNISSTYYEENISSSFSTLDNKSIGKSSEIENLLISEDIGAIEDNLLINCINLSNISVDKNSKYYSSKLGVLFTKDMKKIICYPPLKQTSTYFIPQGVESISSHSFTNSKYLKYVILPTSIVAIDENSFINCKFINQIVIPQNVENIHPRAFSLCPRITVRGYKDSVAENFCKKYFIPFEYLSN